MSQAEQVTPPVAHHGEGPFWDWRSNRLMYVDALAGKVLAVGPCGEFHRYSVPSRAVTVIRRRRMGGFAIAAEHGLIAADEALSTFDHLAEVVRDPAIRTNDGGCDPRGGFVLGTMAYSEEPNRGAVYRVAPNRAVSTLLAPVSISNGIQWSADGTHSFYIDTPTRRVDMFDVDPQTGEWTDRRTHIRIDNTHGFPDGMAIDEDDGLWIALWGGGAVHHYDKMGRLAEIIEVPVTQVTSCTFGGEKRNVLYITTSRKGLKAEEEPAAGALFSIHTSVRGANPADFAG